MSLINPNRPPSPFAMRRTKSHTPKDRLVDPVVPALPTSTNKAIGNQQEKMPLLFSSAHQKPYNNPTINPLKGDSPEKTSLHPRPPRSPEILKLSLRDRKVPEGIRRMSDTVRYRTTPSNSQGQRRHSEPPSIAPKKLGESSSKYPATPQRRPFR